MGYTEGRPHTYYSQVPLLQSYLQSSIVQTEINARARQDLWSLCANLYTQRGTFYDFLRNPANTTILDGCPLNVITVTTPDCNFIFDQTFDCTFE